MQLVTGRLHPIQIYRTKTCRTVVLEDQGWPLLLWPPMFSLYMWATSERGHGEGTKPKVWSITFPAGDLDGGICGL